MKHHRICHEGSVHLSGMKTNLRDTGSLTCLFSVMALGWHLVQIPFGHGRCPSHPDLILQLMFSRATNFPLRKKTRDWVKHNSGIQAGDRKGEWDTLHPLGHAARGKSARQCTETTLLFTVPRSGTHSSFYRNPVFVLSSFPHPSGSQEHWRIPII